MLKKIFKLNWVNSNRRFNDLSLFHYMYCGQPDMSFNLCWNDVASQRAKSKPFVIHTGRLGILSTLGISSHSIIWIHPTSGDELMGLRQFKKRNSRDRVSLMSVTGLILGNTSSPPNSPELGAIIAPVIVRLWASFSPPLRTGCVTSFSWHQSGVVGCGFRG